MSGIIRILITSGQSEDCSRILTILSTQNDFLIAGVEKDETGTIIKSEHLQPDILILDTQSQGIGGEKLAPIIHRRSPSTAIIMLSDKDDENYARLALKSGILGYLLKDKDTDILDSVVKIVFSGGYYISASIVNRFFNTIGMANQYPCQFSEKKEKDPVFSSAERNIIGYIAKGFSDNEIAAYLHLSTGTIRNYIVKIKHKTKQKNRLQAVIFSLVNGLVSPEQIGFMV